jgi:hypothetical protein
MENAGKRERVEIPRKMLSGGLWRIRRLLIEMEGPI